MAQPQLLDKKSLFGKSPLELNKLAQSLGLPSELKLAADAKDKRQIVSAITEKLLQNQQSAQVNTSSTPGQAQQPSSPSGTSQSPAQSPPQTGGENPTTQPPPGKAFLRSSPSTDPSNLKDAPLTSGTQSTTTLPTPNGSQEKSEPTERIPTPDAIDDLYRRLNAVEESVQALADKIEEDLAEIGKAVRNESAKDINAIKSALKTLASKAGVKIAEADETLHGSISKLSKKFS